MTGVLRSDTATWVPSGYTAAVIATLLLNNAINVRNIVFPPEFIGLNKRLFDTFITEIQRLGIKINTKLIK